MINFFWIVLIALVATLLSTALVVAGLYLFWDSIHAFILKRKVPKDKTKFKDGGKTNEQNDKEVNNDGQFRDYERLREEGLRSRERTTEDANNRPGQFTDQPGDNTPWTDSGKPFDGHTQPTEKW